MNDMNVVVYSGRLTKNPELKVTTKDNHFTKFTIAVNKNFLNITTKEYDNKVIFIDCIAYDKQAEFISKYALKGTRVMIQGESSFAEFKNKVTLKTSKVYMAIVRQISIVEKTKEDETHTQEVITPDDPDEPSTGIDVDDNDLPW